MSKTKLNLEKINLFLKAKKETNFKNVDLSSLENLLKEQIEEHDTGEDENPHNKYLSAIREILDVVQSTMKHLAQEN